MARGASERLSFYDAAILNAGAFFGCYTIGVISDLGLGFFNSLTVSTFACAAVAFAWIGAQNSGGVIAWALAYGVLSGALQAIFSPCLSLLAPTPEAIGSWNGKYKRNIPNFRIYTENRSRNWYHCCFICGSRDWSHCRKITG